MGEAAFSPAKIQSQEGQEFFLAIQRCFPHPLLVRGVKKNCQECWFAPQEISPCSAKDGPAKRCNWSMGFQDPSPVRSARASPPSWNPGRPYSATGAPP